MISWLDKFRISSTLDDGRPLSPALRRKLERSPELARFARQTDALGRQLRQDAQGPALPPQLHGSLMRAVRAAPHESPPSARLFDFPWKPALATAAVAVLATWLAFRPAHPDPSPPLHAVGTALRLGQNMAQSFPVEAVKPLAEEWQRLNADLDRTAEFLWASLP